MSPTEASVVCTTGILGLFWLERERKSSTSWAVWLPIAWLFIAGSRHSPTVRAGFLVATAVQGVQTG